MKKTIIFGLIRQNILNFKILFSFILFFMLLGRNVVAVDGRVSYWNFASLIDLDGNNNAENNGATAINEFPTFAVSGDSSPNSLDFDGTGNYLTFSDSSLYDFTSNEMAISVWIKPDKISYDGRIIVFPNDEAAGSIKYSLALSTSNRLQFVVVTSSGSKAITATSAIQADKWQYIYASYDGTKMYLFVNNSLVASDTQTGNIIATTDGKLNIGRFGTNFGQFFDGKIDQLMIFNKNMTPANRTRLFQYGSFVEDVPPTAIITAKDIYSGTNIINFSVIVNGTFKSDISGKVTTNIYTSNTNIWNITIFNSSTHANRTYENYNFSSSGNLIAELYKKNSILINTYQDDGTPIYENFNLILTSDLPSATNYTITNGTLFIEGLTPANYILQGYNDNYTIRTYLVTVMDGSFTNLSMFFSSLNNEDKYFYLKNTANVPLSGATLSMTKLVGSSYMTVGQQTSDSAGYSFFNLDNGQTYRLVITATGYDTKQFDINTITGITSYTVVMLTNTTVKFDSLFSEVTYSYLPTNSTLSADSNQSFSLTVNSPNSLVEWFGVYSATNYTNVTGTPAGGTAFLYLNTSSMDSVKITFFIKVQTFDLFSFDKYFLIWDAPTHNTTLYDAKSDLLAVMGSSSRRINVSAFFIAVFTLIMSFVFRVNTADGSKSLNAIPIVLGIVFFTSIGAIPLFLAIPIGFLNLLGAIPER